MNPSDDCARKSSKSRLRWYERMNVQHGYGMSRTNDMNIVRQRREGCHNVEDNRSGLQKKKNEFFF